MQSSGGLNGSSRATDASVVAMTLIICGILCALAGLYISWRAYNFATSRWVYGEGLWRVGRGAVWLSVAVVALFRSTRSVMISLTIALALQAPLLLETHQEWIYDAPDDVVQLYVTRVATSHTLLAVATCMSLLGSLFFLFGPSLLARLKVKSQP